MIDDGSSLHASESAGLHPRPQLVRSHWADLSGTWRFAFDDNNVGLRERWQIHADFAEQIVVPFPPESEASGVNDTRHHKVAWYAREFGHAEIDEAGGSPTRRLMLRFGAVDYRCQVWVDGSMIGHHEGGHTPFSFDITDALAAGDQHVIVVRVEDDPHDIAQPRGKQDWREEPHVIWYHRTSGIWQPVWLEAVPAIAADGVRWTSDPHHGTVTAQIQLSTTPSQPVDVRVALHVGGRALGSAQTSANGDIATLVIPVDELANGQAYEELLWSPENPRLIDADIDVAEDHVSSYLGIRTTHVARGRFFLNDRPYYVRSVLNQGYWPQSHLAAPSADALRAEAQLVKDLGFNATRVHQKFEDPRFLYWADRLGLLVWGEAPANFTFSPTSIERTVREWLEIVRRDYSHPSIVTWVPLNESWGVQHVSFDERMQHFARSLVDLTKALDPTRPVVSNDGWEQVDTDIVAIHDYEADADVVRARYATRAAIDELIDGVGPAGRPLIVSGDVTHAPVMLTEFGGIAYDVDATDHAWGYSSVGSAEEFGDRLERLMAAVWSSATLAGFCYTQLADTLQEANGLVRPDRTPKIDASRIRAIMTNRPLRSR